MIHAGASGVGTAAIQLVKYITQARVIVTAGSKEKLEFCKKLGADIGINYKEQEFDSEILKSTDNKGVDLILDFVSASYWQKNINSIKIDGRWILIGILGGVEVEKMNILQILMRRIQIAGTLLTPRSIEYKSLLLREFSKNILPYFENKIVTPVIDKVFQLDDIKMAHRYTEENLNIGKIIIEVAK